MTTTESTQESTGERRTGGCLCGAVRYETAWPPLITGVCHCRHCQRQAGSAFSVIAGVPFAGLERSGTLTTYEDDSDAGRAVYRKFCGTCGSPVFTETPDGMAQGMIFIKAGTLDDPKDLAPTLHFWTSMAQDWVVIPESANKLEAQ
jgi:hypothetical protein